MRKLIVFAFLMGLIYISAGCIQRKEIVTFNSNFNCNNVFLIEEEYEWLDIYNYKIYFSDWQLKEKQLIYQNSGLLDNIIPNPKNNLLLFTDYSEGEHLINIYDVDSKKYVLRKEIYMSSFIGWHPDGNKIYFSLPNGIQILDLNSKVQQKLIIESGLAPGVELYCLGWSKSGTSIVYMTEKTDEIFLYDFRNKSNKLLAKTTKIGGRFDKAYFTDNLIVYIYSTGNANDNYSEYAIGLFNLNDGKAKDVYKAFYKIEDLYLIDENQLLFLDKVSDKISTINLKSSKITPLNIGEFSLWKYDEQNHKLIIKEAKSNRFRLYDIKSLLRQTN